MAEIPLTIRSPSIKQGKIECAILKGKRMLILTAKVGELIYIGKDIKIVVLPNEYSEHELSLGFDAPDHIHILRQKAKVKFKKVKENA